MRERIETRTPSSISGVTTPHWSSASSAAPATGRSLHDLDRGERGGRRRARPAPRRAAAGAGRRARRRRARSVCGSVAAGPSRSAAMRASEHDLPGLPGDHPRGDLVAGLGDVEQQRRQFLDPRPRRSRRGAWRRSRPRRVALPKWSATAPVERGRRTAAVLAAGGVPQRRGRPGGGRRPSRR